MKASKFLQVKDEKKPAFGQNKVRADIFSGSLAVFQSEKVRLPRGGRKGGVWGEFKRARQPIFPSNIFYLCVRSTQAKSGLFRNLFLR